MRLPDAESLYDLLVEDEDARVCRELDDDACREVPGNFFLQLAASGLTKLGDQLINPKTTLAWILSAAAAPVWMIGWLVPIRESGSLLPQLVIAAFVRSRPIRKWVWVVGSFLQGIAVLAMAFAVATLSGAAAGWCVLGALTLFSLARGLCSVAGKDVMGKTVPKTRRGRLGGLASSISGLVAIAGSLAMLTIDSSDVMVLATLLAIAGGCWFLACVFYARVVEFPGETDGGANALGEALASVSLLRDDAPFRRFVLARSLLLVSALTGPYIVLMARDSGLEQTAGLPLFIIAAGLASFLSSPFWGRFSDRSSRMTMVIAASFSTLIAGCALLWNRLGGGSAGVWPYLGLFLLLAIAHSGVRLGRKTYVVDLAEGNRRTDYVAVSNTSMGIVLLTVGAITGLASTVSIDWALGLLVPMGAAGALMSWSLPEVQDGL